MARQTRTRQAMVGALNADRMARGAQPMSYAGMSTELVKDIHAGLNRRYAEIVSRTLRCSVTFSRLAKCDGTDAMIPVFRVPAENADEARALGLTVEVK